MLLGAATRIWLEGALCHENSKICQAPRRLAWLIGHKYGGSEEATVRMWIATGQTRRSSLGGGPRCG